MCPYVYIVLFEVMSDSLQPLGTCLYIHRSVFGPLTLILSSINLSLCPCNVVILITRGLL